jgi:asparagine synthase (glutamine-hydrolysing)
MCGIFCYLSNNDKDTYSDNELYDMAMKIKHRGPDNTKQIQYASSFVKMNMIFHRLAINGLSESGDQPFDKNNIILECNGEIYNYRELFRELDMDYQTKSDCEVILHLYLKYGMGKTIQMLDGVFSFVLYDKRKNHIYVGHDPIGVRSLYWFTNDNEIGISSEMKSLVTMSNHIQMFPTGTYCCIDLDQHVWKPQFTNYYVIDYPTIHWNEMLIMKQIRMLLTNAVTKRMKCDYGDVCCLLSGGLDSSIITALASQISNNIHTYSIGFKGSVDVHYSDIVSEHLNTHHTSVIVSEEEMLQAIEETIYQIETYDVTTIRASVPMYLLSKYISKHTSFKVVLSGEGADESSGSYLYFHNAPNEYEFQRESLRLMKDNQHFDILRADKTTAGAGLELRVPFYDKEFINYYMSISPRLKMVRDKYEKYLLRKTFEDILPEEITWRRKDGFSDGVSSMNKPWYSIIEEYTQRMYQLSEKEWYKQIFMKYYSTNQHIVPYQWLPKWSGDLKNPSNRLIIS